MKNLIWKDVCNNNNNKNTIFVGGIEAGAPSAHIIDNNETFLPQEAWLWT